MNYITEIKAFHDKVELNGLSSGQIALWYALMYINNKCGWLEWFTVPNQVLSIHSGLSRSGILKARNQLKQLGLLDFKERGTKATAYKLVTMSESKQVSNQYSMQDSTQDGHQDSVQNSDTLNKQKHKLNKTKKRSTKVLPEKFCESEPLNNAILAFLAHRKAMKAPMTEHAIELMLKKLNKMTEDEDEKIEILNQSIMNSWKGIFELKEKKKGSTSRKQQTEEFYDDMKEWVNEHECN
nr:MAG TPA: helix-turn-helix domain protein [Caudoviricetes sp.]